MAAPWSRFHPRTLAWTAVGLAVVVLTAAVLVATLNNPLAPPGDTEPDPDAAGFALLDLDGQIDSDNDGLADAAENYVTGSDPGNWSSNGDPIPDGWLAKYGHDPLRPGAAYGPAAAPPADKVPAAYGADGRTTLTPTLLDVYSFGRPADWNEATDGPWSNGLDPRLWDQNGDDIPDGFMLLHGLDPTKALADSRLAGASGLTVREAFTHNTNPSRLDSDGDGLNDRWELDGRLPDGTVFLPSNPARFDSNGAGACDGYLVHHGLDPNDGNGARADPDNDGATTAEEAAWSFATHGAKACAGTAGTDPTKAHSGDSAIPDGWFIRYGLDPFETDVDKRETHNAATPTTDPVLDASAGELNLTILGEYRANRPADWNEARSGPWWGGTDPTKLDTDGDGLSDAWELRGYTIQVATDVGDAEKKTQAVRPDPTRRDTDGDGLSDKQEASSETPSDATRRDTDLDGLPDATEAGITGLDPLKADSAGDFLTDGARFLFLKERAATYAKDLTYAPPDVFGPPGTRTVPDWLTDQLQDHPDKAKLLPLDAARVSALVGPDGDLDGDGDSNLVDRDMDDDGLPNGIEMDPTLYTRAGFEASNLPGGRPGTDPLNVDTDGDGLEDGWEAEHGIEDIEIGRYDPDPSRYDTNADGRPDGEEDPDQDSIQWFSYDDSVPAVVTSHIYSYNNLEEQEFETDPRNPSSDGDGLKDGWKAFWGIRYPAIDPAVVAGSGVVPPLIGTPQGDTVLTTTYTKRLDVFDTTIESRVLPHEKHSDGTPRLDTTVYTINNGGGQHKLAIIHGERPFTFLDAQESQTNPYVADSDGDGMPDDWEWTHAEAPPDSTCTGINGPRATHPDGDADPDHDDLPNLKEYLADPDPTDTDARSLHPMCPDTDHGTALDGEEDELDLDGLDPRDDFVENCTPPNDDCDLDDDGLRDLEERRDTRTDPLNPDTDGDGLLDGKDLRLAASSDAAKRLMDLGIAFRPDGSDLFFYGEKAFGYHSLDPDPNNHGIPQGWLVARGLGSNPTANSIDAYELGRPLWWNEAAHGPWWGGGRTTSEAQGNGAALTDPDLDRDGLLDARGEDPFPATNHGNVPADVDPTLHSLAAWDTDTDPLDAGLTPLERRLAAQAQLNPRLIGDNGLSRDPDPASHTGPHHADRITPSLTAVVPDEIAKGQTFQVTGTVTGAPKLAGLTVIAERNGQVIGAGFTDANGAFDLTAGIVPQHSLTIPDEAIVFMGQTSGTVTWDVDTAAIPLGSGTLVVRTYATPNTAPYTDTWSPLYSVADSHAQSFITPSTLTLTVPAEAIVGQEFEITAVAIDGSGDPLGDPIRIQTPHGAANLQPDSNGVVTQRITPTTADAGTFAISARTLPPPGSPVATAQDSDTTRVLLPVTVTIEPLPPQVEAGQAVRVRGMVSHALGAANGLDITVSGADQETTTRTGTDGRFDTWFQIPADLEPGNLVLSVVAEASSTTQRGATSGATTVLGLPVISDSSTILMPLGDLIHISGRITEPDGTAMAGAKIHYTLGPRTGTLTSDVQGKFQTAVEWLPPTGPSLQVLTFDGDPTHAPATHTLERFPVSTTKISVQGQDLPLGANLTVAARLLDSEDRPIEGVSLRIDGAVPARSAVTDAAGTIRVGFPSKDLGVGFHRINVTFAGAPDGSLLGVEGFAIWTLTSQSSFVPDSDTYVAGDPAPRARLIDTGFNVGLPGAPVLRAEGDDERTLETDEMGYFPLFDALPATAEPTTRTIETTFFAFGIYPTDHDNLTVRVVSPVHLGASLDSPPVAGKETTIRVTAVDGRGIAPAGTVQAYLDGELVSQASLVRGRAALPITPAADAEGPAALEVRFVGTDTHGAANHAQTLDILRPTDIKLTITELPDGKARIDVVATRDGQPLAFRRIHLAIEGIPGGIDLDTDETGRASYTTQRSLDDLTVAARLEAQPGEEPALATADLGNPLPAPGPGIPWLAIVVGIIAAAGIAALAVVAVRLLRHRSPIDDELREAVRTARGRGAIEEVILHAYFVLQKAGIKRGWLDEEAGTPRALQEAFTTAVPNMPAAPLDSLVGLFEQARYGNHNMRPNHRDAAVEALTQIRRATAWGGRA